jgi:REP-associated tyrosine transposase
VCQHLGREYVQYVNKRYKRTGTLWEGRHKGSLIDAENYLLRCYHYIEINPVTASMVEAPEQYPWSSYQANALGQPESLVTPHPVYCQLSRTPSVRCSRYRELFRERLSSDTVDEIRNCLTRNQVLGSRGFEVRVEAEFMLFYRRAFVCQ